MKKIRIVVLFIIFIVFGFILGAYGCNSYAYNNKAEEENINVNAKYIDSFCKSKYNGVVDIFEYIDKETGVVYIIVGSYHSSGTPYDGISITPKLDINGNPYVIN